MNQVVKSISTESGTRISLVLGDITVENVDAIVNAANSQLAHGGGVAGTIARRGGPVIQRESTEKAPVPVGEAAYTTAGNLLAKYVIHAVGPRWGEGDEDEKLHSAVRSSLDLASSEEVAASSISMPAISTGIFGFPLERAVKIILSGIKDWTRANPSACVKEIRLCLFDSATLDAFLDQFDTIFGDDEGGA